MSDIKSISTANPIRRILIRLGLLVLACMMLYLGGIANDRLYDYYQDVIRQCGIAIILAVSLNIVNGLTGQFSIGHAGFMSVGAYTGASVTYLAEMRFTHNQTPGWQWIVLAMGAGGLMAALFGYVVGVPSLRLRGDYLAIVTLGFGEIIRVLIEDASEINPSLGYLGGATGFSGASGAYSVPRLATFPIVFGTALLVIVLVRNLKFSSHGLAFMSVREDEIAADAMGVNTTKVKVTSFVLSSLFAGAGGVLFAHAHFFKPDTFGFILSMNYVIMVVLGGSGSITGSVLAAVVLTTLPEFLKPVQDRLHFADEYRIVIYALLLVIMMLLRPTGVFGTGEIGLGWLRRRLGRRSSIDSSSSVQTDAGDAALQETSTSVTGPGPAPEIPSIGAPDVISEPHRPIVLDITDLTRRFGGLTAVGSVNLRLHSGELVGLIGPNGAGKTTVFNLLTGVYEPSEGRIDFDGSPIAGERALTPMSRAMRVGGDTLAAVAGGWILGVIISTSIVPYPITSAAHRVQFGVKIAIALSISVFALSRSLKQRRFQAGLKPYQFAYRGISRTFQNIRLFSDLTVLENVRLGAYLRRRTTLFDALFRTLRLEHEESESIDRARALLARFNLLRLENEKAKNLPYGDQRRLEIVRALATSPRLLLLDEPAAGMNPFEKAQLMSLIRQIRDEFNLTILLIEHDMKLVMGVCERIYVLDYGRIIAEGAPAAIRSNPSVIAAYLGEEFAEEPSEGAAVADNN